MKRLTFLLVAAATIYALVILAVPAPSYADAQIASPFVDETPQPAAGNSGTSAQMGTWGRGVYENLFPPWHEKTKTTDLAFTRYAP